MKKLVIFLIIAAICILGFAYLKDANWNFKWNEDTIPELTSEKMEFGEISYDRDNTALYTVNIQKIKSEYDYVDEKVNEYIDMLATQIKEQDFKSEDGKLREKDILVQTIDTYEENDTKVVKVTYLLKRYNEKNYTKNSKTFYFKTSEEE